MSNNHIPIEYTPSLRDQFAMAALTGQLACRYISTIKDTVNVSLNSYAIANAMMEARKAGSVYE